MSSQILANVFDIQHFSIGDGPGIRTTVFLKGCPLKCDWCHNPESLTSNPQIMYYNNKCSGCGACVLVCPNNCHKFEDGKHIFDSKNCINCKKCVDACNFFALEVVGKKMSVQEVMSAIEEDLTFYESSQGGLTISGGEPMYQPDFAIALAKSAKEKGIHVCLETSGFCATEKLKAILPYVDIFLFDYKATGNMHKKLTGVDNALILDNLITIDSLGAKIVLRCPMVFNGNLNDEHINGIISVAKKLTNLEEINLEPYHNIGISKISSLGIVQKTNKYDTPKKEVLKNLADKIEQATKIKTIIM